MLKVIEAVGSAVKNAGLRGPEPPYLVCPKCGCVSDTPWPNPMLLWAKRKGMYAGDCNGGLALCPDCERAVEAEKASQDAARTPEGMPAEFRSANLDNYKPMPGNTNALKAANRFLDIEATHDLYLAGAVGVGKSRLAASIANAMFRKQQRAVRFERVPALLVKLQEGMHKEGESQSLFEYVHPDLLVLDDIGVEKGSDYSRRTIQTLYDMRRDHGRRTIWTSNLNLNQLADFTDDDRLPSRIAGAADVVFIDGEDQRPAGRPRFQGRKPTHG